MSERERDGGGSARPGGSDGESEVTEGQQQQGADPFEGLVLDEEFVRGASQSEPSARARMLAERWRQEPPRNTGFREAANKEMPWRARARRGGDGPRRTSGPRDRTNVKVAVWFVIVATVLLVASSRGLG
ncbi:hypothetical protein OG216_15760 [Streptomycetaceae bacterium NBC_01309]